MMEATANNEDLVHTNGGSAADDSPNKIAIDNSILEQPQIEAINGMLQGPSEKANLNTNEQSMLS